MKSFDDLDKQYRRISQETERRYGWGSSQAVRNAKIFGKYQSNFQRQPAIAKAMQQAKSLMKDGKRNEAMAIEGRMRHLKLSRSQYMGLNNG